MLRPPDRLAHRSTAGLIRLLGPLIALDDRGEILRGVAPGRATLLLQRVATAGGSAVDTEELVDTLWPDRAPPSAPRTLAALVSRVRTALGSSVITGQPSDGYRLGVSEGWTTDLLELERFGDEARRHAANAPALAASSARRALDLLGDGRLLASVPEGDAEWYDTAQRRIDVLGAQIRRIAWEAEAALGRWSEVVRLAEDHLAGDPVDEAAARTLMDAHVRLGDRGSALRVHERLSAHLLESLGVGPSAETTELHDRIVEGVSPRPTDSGRPGDVIASRMPVRAPIGRDRELALLLDHWERAVGGRGSVVILTGARGSGRTRMVETLRDVVTATGGRAVLVRSAEGDASGYLHPLLRLASQLLLSIPESDVRDLLGGWGPAAADLLPELAPLLPPPDRRPLSPDLAHHRALQLLLHVFGRAAERGPLLLVLDDLHRSSTSMLDAVNQLLDELVDSPILMVGTALGDEPLPVDTPMGRSISRIRLGPLDRLSVTELAREAGVADDADAVWQLTHGHLHFVVEVIRLLSRGVAVEDLPRSFGELVSRLVDQWGATDREVLGAAATIGIGFELMVLEELTGRRPHELLPSLETAMASGYIEEDGARLTFTNEAIRLALLRSLPRPVARRHHLRLADILADLPDRRAAHLVAAGLPERAAPVWLEAARRAQLEFANGDAERFATEAIETAESIRDDALLTEALLTRGAAREQLGDHDGATADHRRAGDLWLRTGDRSLRARAVERIGWSAYYRRDRDEAVRRAEEAVSLPGTHPGAWALLGRVRHWSGDLDQAADAYRRALRELSDDEAARASVLSCLGALYAHGDRFEEAITVLDEAVELANDIGAFRPLLRTLFFRGLALANHGRLAEALTTLETKSALLDRYGVRYYRARTNTSMAWIWRELGDAGRADHLSTMALEQSLEVDDQVLQLEQELHARCALADVAAGRGDLAAAAEQIEVCRGLLDRWMPFRWRAELRVVEIGARLGVDDPEHLLAIARERRSAKYEALALHLLGRPGEASRVAVATGSDLLLAEVGTPADAERARRSLLHRLPDRLRADAVTRGRLFVAGA